MEATATPPVETLKANQGKTIRYSDEDLKEFQDLLLQKREQELALLKEMEESFNSFSDSSSSSEGIYEAAAENLDKEFLANQIVRKRQFLNNVGAALQRIQNKSYGICAVSGELIPKERLLLVPITTKCVQFKSK